VSRFVRKFSASSSGETARRMPKLVWQCGYHRAEFGRARPSHAAGTKKFDVFCFFLRRVLNGKVCERHFVIKAFEGRDDLDVIGYGKRFVDVQSRSTLSLCC